MSRFRPLSLLMLLALAGCGYRFTVGGPLPAGLESVAVTLLENRTAEIGAEQVITNELIYEFTRNGHPVRSADAANGVLSGEVTNMAVETVSRAGEITSLERRITATVRLILVDRDGERLWTGAGIQASEAYAVFSEKVATDTSKRRAIRTLARRLAERVYGRIQMEAGRPAAEEKGPGGNADDAAAPGGNDRSVRESPRNRARLPERKPVGSGFGGLVGHAGEAGDFPGGGAAVNNAFFGGLVDGRLGGPEVGVEGLAGAGRGGGPKLLGRGSHAAFGGSVAFPPDNVLPGALEGGFVIGQGS
jgi:hypothetical protein